jgi:hypothetical protein
MLLLVKFIYLGENRIAMKKGQVSIEFLSIFSFVFLMTVPLIIIFFDQAGFVKDAISENQIKNIAIKITDKAETVYYSGEPSKTTLKVYLPENVEAITIGGPSGNTISFTYLASKNIIKEIYEVSRVNLTGSMDTKPGIHFIEIESSGGEVLIKDI